MSLSRQQKRELLSKMRLELESKGAIIPKGKETQEESGAPLCFHGNHKKLRCPECKEFTMCPKYRATCWPCVDRAVQQLKAWNAAKEHGKPIL